MNVFILDLLDFPEVVDHHAALPDLQLQLLHHGREAAVLQHHRRDGLVLHLQLLVGAVELQQVSFVLVDQLFGVLAVGLSQLLHLRL